MRCGCWLQGSAVRRGQSPAPAADQREHGVANHKAIHEVPAKKVQALSSVAVLSHAQRMDPADVIATMISPVPVYGQKGDLRSYALFINFWGAVCSKTFMYDEYQIRPRLIACADERFIPEETEEVVKVVDIMQKIGSMNARDYASVLHLGRDLLGIDQGTKIGHVSLTS